MFWFCKLWYNLSLKHNLVIPSKKQKFDMYAVLDWYESRKIRRISVSEYSNFPALLADDFAILPPPCVQNQHLLSNMAAKTHVDSSVGERRLRPIYGNNAIYIIDILSF